MTGTTPQPGTTMVETRIVNAYGDAYAADLSGDATAEELAVLLDHHEKSWPDEKPWHIEQRTVTTTSWKAVDA